MLGPTISLHLILSQCSLTIVWSETVTWVLLELNQKFGYFSICFHPELIQRVETLTFFTE